jgi:hypothetical protein
MTTKRTIDTPCGGGIGQGPEEDRTMVTTRTADMWWAWHDQDQDRWSASTEEADARCAAWVAGRAEDGPLSLRPRMIETPYGALRVAAIIEDDAEAMELERGMYSAGEAGDLDMVNDCRAALAGDVSALRRARRAIQRSQP